MNDIKDLCILGAYIYQFDVSLYT